jgi:hypothetical protein
MSTMTKQSRKVKPFTTSFVSITISINDTRYSVDPFPAGEFGTKAFRLSKHSGDHAVYDVVRTHLGIVECDCADFESRHRGNGGVCKHGRALVALELLAAPTAVAELAPDVELEPAVEPTERWGQVPRCHGAGCISSRHLTTVADGSAWCSSCYDRECMPGGRFFCCAPDEPAACVVCVGTPPPAGEPIPSPAAVEPAIAAELPDGDVECDPADWPAWTDTIVTPTELEPDFEVTLEPSAEDLDGFMEWTEETAARNHLDVSGRLPLIEAIDRQADFYRTFGNPFGELLGRVLEELAQKARYLEATTPADLQAGLEKIDCEARETWERVGFENGRAAVRPQFVDIDDPAARRGRPTFGAAHGAFPCCPWTS